MFSVQFLVSIPERINIHGRIKKEELICENNTIEYKSAKGGLPNSLYETYSAFANSYGGTIYFGIAEISKEIYTSSHLSETDVEKLCYDLFSTINNKKSKCKSFR